MLLCVTCNAVCFNTKWYMMSLGFMSFSDAFCCLNLSQSISSRSAALGNRCWIQWILQWICASHAVKSGYPVLPLANPSKISLPGLVSAVARDSHSKRGKTRRKSENCLQHHGPRCWGRVPVSSPACKPSPEDGAGCKGWCWMTLTSLFTHQPFAKVFSNSTWEQKGFFPVARLFGMTCWF